MRHDAIKNKGLETHINEHCMRKDLPWRFKNFVEWLERGDEFGERMPTLKLARLFKVSRPTMEKWLSIYNEEKSS